MTKPLDADRIVKAMLDAIEPQLAGLAKRMDTLEARPLPVNGKDGVGIADHVTDQSGFLVLTLTDGRSLKTGVKSGENGRDADPETIAKCVKAEVAAQLPEAVAKIETIQGEPGPSPDMDAIKGMVDEAVAALPKPENGRDGAPGCGIAKAEINADGELVITYTDGEEKNIGRVVGAPGQPGDPGGKGDPGDKGDDGLSIADAVIGPDASLVLTFSDGTTKNLGRVVGAPGVDGKDGLGFEDLEEELCDDGRVIIRRYKKGAQVKEFRHRVPAVIYRGVWKDMEAVPGDAVTWGGSLWICRTPTDTKPGTNDAWQLAVKRGSDGKDGEKGDPGKDAK